VDAVELASIVDSTNGVPIVVERAMWWPHGQWYEAHLSAGATETGTRWAVADCQVAKNGTGGSVLFANEVETYLLIANTSATAGTVTLTLDPSYNSDLIHPQPTVTLPLPAYGRLSVPLSGVLASTAAVMITSFPVFGDFSLLVESSGPQIVVERSVYSNYGGQLWAAGTSALGTKLQ
jgi:hypothetical protein